MLKYTLWTRSSSAFVSVQSGNWNSHLTWKIKGTDGNLYSCPYYPERGNDVYIEAGHTVTLTQNEAAALLNNKGSVVYNAFTLAVSIDSDVTAYQSAISTDSGSLTGSRLLAYDSAVKRLKQEGLWSKFVDIWAPEGGNILAALNKIKYPVAFPKMLNNGSTAFVDADYSNNKGVTNAAYPLFKRLDTQIVPGTYSLSQSDLFVYAAIRDNGPASTGANLLSDNPVSGTTNLVFTKGRISINGTGTNGAFPAFDKVPYHLSFSTNGTARFRKNYKDRLIPQVGATFSITTSISIFSGINSGVATSCNGSIAFTAIGHYLTADETNTLTHIVQDLLIALGRASTVKDYVQYGDSITQGVGASTESKRSSALAAVRWGLQEANNGLSSSQYLQISNQIPAGFENRGDLLNFNILNGGRVTIHYGTNDMRADTSTGPTGSGDPAKYNAFRDNLIVQVNELLAAGMAHDKIIIRSIFINDETTQHSEAKKLNWVAAARAAAVATGVLYVDTYNYCKTHGDVAVLMNSPTDRVHPNDAGYQAIDDSDATASFVY